jgi:hypothetical protein
MDVANKTFSAYYKYEGANTCAGPMKDAGRRVAPASALHENHPLIFVIQYSTQPVKTNFSNLELETTRWDVFQVLQYRMHSYTNVIRARGLQAAGNPTLKPSVPSQSNSVM